MSTPETLTRELAALDDALAGRPVDPDLADLAELATLVRDERPEPGPAFTRSLDSRVERGFPRVGKRPRLGITWPKITLPALGMAASVLLVVVIATSVPGGGDDEGGGGGAGSVGTTAEPGSSSGGGSESSGAGGSGASGSDESAARKESAPSAADAIEPDTGSGAPAPAVVGPLPLPPEPGPNADRRSRRSVERSAQIVIATPPREVDRAAAKIIRVADDLGGYVVASQVTSGSSGEFELRVPERRLQRALSRLSGIGKVRERTQSAQDITAAVVSVEERLKDARTERRSLLRQLAKAVTPNQTESIRGRMRLVSRQIAAAKRDLRRVKTRASYSTIAVQLLADRRAASDDDEDDSAGWTPGDALDDAVRILEVSAGVLLVAGALLLPVGLVALLVGLAMRQAAQRRRERALDAV
jgi:Domain of unknown function (DUF4349)